MSLFRKFFYRKPPDKLLEISERVYVFDCCFSNDVLEEVQYKDYIGGVGAQLRSQFPDASFMVFNFREGETQSLISNILTEYDMTVMDYPRHYEGCPLLTMEMIHHFLRSSESWLSLCQQNIILMHCERGGWPVLAFMLAGLLIYRRQYTGEQKTLDMIYKQAPCELMQLLSPLNPLPSQLRYLQYVSRRNVGSEWPPLDRALTLDCVILRIIPKFDGEGGCRPIFRIYGQDPFIATDRIPKVLFSTPKSSKNVRHYKESDCELVKIDIHCHIQGDVVLECISLDEDLEREEMMFRVMFNTAFIRSNILMLNRDEIDILWNAKDRFPKDFRAEVLLSEMDAAASLITVDLGGLEEKEGLPVEAFAKVQEIFNSIDWMDQKVDPTLSVIQQIASSNAMQEKLDIINSLVETKKLSASNTVHDKIMLEFNSLLEPIRDQHKENLKTYSEHKSKSGPPFALQQLTSSVKTSPHSEPAIQKARPQDFPVAVQRPAQLNIIAPHVPQPAFSNPVSHCNSLRSSPLPLSRYHSAPSALGITAVLGDHTASHGSKEGTHLVTKSPQSLSTAAELNFGNSMNPISSVPSSSPSPSIAPSVGPMIDSSKPPPLTPPEDPKPSPRSPIVSSFEAPLILPQTQDFRPHSALPSRCEYQSVSKIPVPPPLPLGPTPLPSLTTKINFPSTPCLPPPPPLTPPTTSLSASSPHSTSKKPPTPPAPPLHFELASCPASKPSIPPPLAQPHVSPGPPNAPPPPTSTSGGSSPFSKGVDGASTNLDSKGINGGVRPPPPGILPNFAAKGWGLSRSTGPKSDPTLKKTSLKPLHWVKVTRAMQGSLWAESHKHDETSKAPEFDMKELESLFSAVVPKSDQGKNEKSSRRSSLGAKSGKIHLIDLRRANNCEIMLTKVKMPFPDLMNSLLALDETVLDADQVDNLIRFCPTKEEIELLKGFTGEKENLGRCEQFFLELMKVPRVESKLRVFSFKIQFHSQVSDLRNSLNIVNSVSEEIRKSAKLKRIMQTILSLGNALNQGTARGSAIGFRLDSLLKLTDTRARNHKMTLMHYLCKVLAEKLPELLDFHCDLVSLEAAAKIQLKTLAEEMQAISKGLEKVEQELTASENDGSISQNFTKALKEFLVVAEAEVRSLTSLYSGVGRSADALAIYFGEDPSRCQIEQVVSTLLNFVKMFCRDHDDNCKQLELEKKKAENEKMKINTHRKDSEHLTHSPVRSGRTT